MSTTKTLSVVILNWNGASQLRKFLPSVVRNSPEAHIIVADNGSTDDSLELLRQSFPTVGTLRLDRNYGFAEGYNRAMESVTTPLALLLNNDVEVPPRWLVPLLDFLDAHPEAAACQPKLLSYSDRRRFEYAGAAGGFIDSLGYPYCRGRIFRSLETDEGQYDTPVPILWASGAALLVRTRLYREAGGLDARFFAHQEEIDLCWRLWSLGYTIWCIPSSCVYHVGAQTLKKSNSDKTFLNFRNNLLLLYKNLPSSRLRVVMPLRWILDHIAALQMFLTGRGSDALALLRARAEYSHIRHEFDPVRRANLQRARRPVHRLLSPGSILWQYYLRRRTTYSRLPVRPLPQSGAATSDSPTPNPESDAFDL